VRFLLAFTTSDWYWACVLMSLNIFFPLVLLLDALKQKVLKMRGIETDQANFSPWVKSVVKVLESRSITSILCKVNLLCELYFTLFIGVAKVTSVFLSWLNEMLLGLDLGVVMAVFFVIGFLMFLAPPVPGIPVYICSGIVIAERAKTTDVGYVGGIGLAVTLSFVLKLTAVAGQYAIGFFLAKSVKIQQLVGVDKVATRSVEKILLQKGLTMSKAAVLVGGPDWPTSVLCGILKLNLFQCILGTVPVILVSSPCVVAGALMVGSTVAATTTTLSPSNSTMDLGPPSSPKEQIWSALSSTALGISAITQLASGILALYYIQEVIIADGEELAKHRPEHDPVLTLTQKEQEYVAAYAAVTQWHRLGRPKQLLLVGGTAMNVASTGALILLDTTIFRPFAVSNRMSDSFDNGGLENNALNLVRLPGWIALGAFSLACFMHFFFSRMVFFSVERYLRSLTQVSPAPS
ncbi:unnamed protein product, partial [Polarella glacialis]